MPGLPGDLVRHQLATHTFGQNVVSTERVDSTNTALKKAARRGAPEGLLYLTNEQTGGRGRMGRAWYAPPDSSLLLSLLFRPGRLLAPHQAQRLTMLCALAMAQAVETEVGLAPGLKWPNDLVWEDGKKLGGILTELEIEEGRLSWAVVGLGLNVNIDFGQPQNGGQGLAGTATSLSMILGQDAGAYRLSLLRAFLVEVERRYRALWQGHLPHREWRSRLVGLGQPVAVATPRATYRGTMAGVNKNGALLLEQADGSTITILAGDVSRLG